MSRAPKPRRPAAALQTLELTIDHLGARGDGVGRAGEQVVFVPLTVPGDRVLARVEAKRGDGLAAGLVEVTSPGPDRVAPPCPHFGACGGCSLQHLSADAYAVWKREQLVTALARAGVSGAWPVAPLVQTGAGNRRRAAFAYTRRKGQAEIGFNARNSHALVDLRACLLLAPAVFALLDPLRRILARVAHGTGGDVVVTETLAGLDVLVEGEARLDLFAHETLVAFAEAQDLARLSWRRPGSGMIEPVVVRRKPFVQFGPFVQCGAVAVEPPPGAFLQPSLAGEQAITRLVLDAVAPVAGKGPVADLFCGCGSFSLPLAALAPVHAAEGDASLVAALKAAADRTQTRVTTETRDLFRRPLAGRDLKRFTAVVFDPPRAGAAEQALALAEAGPGLVVAVSCNPTTLARDLRVLIDGGYRVESVTPIDQFPWSAHLEAVAVLRR